MLRVLHETISKRDNLKKYDLIVIGNLTASYFAREFHKYTKDLYSILLVNNQSQFQLTQGAYSRIVDPSTIVDGTSVSVTNGVSLNQVDFERKEVTLTNGRNINYERLVIAQELEDDTTKILGLNEALRDSKHPVFSRAIDFNFKDNKNIKSLNKVCAGDIYYYIPRFPFNGQEDFVSPIRLYETIRRNNTNIKERLSINYHIVTPNESLPPQNDSYSELLKSLNINLLTQTEILSIDKLNRIIKLRQGHQDTQHEYDAIYLSGRDAKSPKWIQNEGVMDVNPQTLQHNKYQSVFALGAPTFSTYYTTEQVQNQIQLAKINVLLSLQGQKCKEGDTSSQSVSYYIGNYKTASTGLPKKSSIQKLIQNIGNNSVGQHIRYVWQSQFKHRLAFIDELNQSLIFNRIYGRFVAEGERETIKILNQQNKQEQKLKYSVERKAVDAIAINQLLKDFQSNMDQSQPSKKSQSFLDYIMDKQDHDSNKTVNAESPSVQSQQKLNVEPEISEEKASEDTIVYQAAAIPTTRIEPPQANETKKSSKKAKKGK